MNFRESGSSKNSGKIQQSNPGVTEEIDSSFRDNLNFPTGN